jgi:hypothetical protein
MVKFLEFDIPPSDVAPVDVVRMELVVEMVGIRSGIVHHTTWVLRDMSLVSSFLSFKILTFIHPAGEMKW